MQKTDWPRHKREECGSSSSSSTAPAAATPSSSGGASNTHLPAGHSPPSGAGTSGTSTTSVVVPIMDPQEVGCTGTYWWAVLLDCIAVSAGPTHAGFLVVSSLCAFAMTACLGCYLGSKTRERTSPFSHTQVQVLMVMNWIIVYFTAISAGCLCYHHFTPRWCA